MYGYKNPYRGLDLDYPGLDLQAPLKSYSPS